MSRHLNNFLLARLDEPVIAALTPHLAITRLEQGRVLSEMHSKIDKVYFPHGGIISCVVELVGGGAIETGMIGKDGQFGAGPAMDHKVSLNHVVVQVAGDVSIIDGARFRQVAEEHPALRVTALAFEQFMTAQIQQTAACNAVHKVPARICKWLLRMHKLVGDEMPLTQEFLAQMMGVRRTSVTLVAKDMQRAGLITYHRGHLRILDVKKLQKTACEFDESVNAHFDRIFQSGHGTPRSYSNEASPDLSIWRTVFRDTFRSRLVSLIVALDCSRRIRGIVPTISISDHLLHYEAGSATDQQ